MYIEDKTSYNPAEMNNSFPALSRGSEGYDTQQYWLIKNLIPSESFGVLYGASGSYKSFLTLDICCSIATGKKWSEYKTKKKTVLFIAAEGATGIKRRVKAWEKTNATTADSIYIYDQTVSPSTLEGRSTILNIVAEIKNSDSNEIGLIVFDTLSRCFIGDENTARDMGMFISGCESIIKETKASVLCVHHSGKDESKGCRGSSKLFADADFVFQQKRIAKSEPKATLVNHKQKDEELMPNLSITFEKVCIGIYCDEGREITSLVRTQPATIKKDGSSSDGNLMTTLRDTFGGNSTRAAIRSALFKPTDGKISDADRKKFSRELTALSSSGLINVQQHGDRAADNDIISLVQ